MTTSELIRAAALGPAPSRPRGRYLMDWLGAGSRGHVRAREWLTDDLPDFWDADVAVKRMALLFVAEAIK